MKQIDGLVTKDEIYRLISGFRTRFKISEEAAHEMAKRVAEMPTVEAEPDNGWISVKYRLPENDGLYIVCRTFKGYQICFEARWEGNKWVSVVNNNQLVYVTHWQPLPEPPKEECDWVDDDSLPNEDMRPDNEVI